jgi:hypothetical protein
MDDGVQLDEEILAFERSSVHEYAWTRGLKPPLSWMVTRGQGRWDFSADGEGTRVQWSYCFTLSSPLAYPVGWAAARFFRTWMVNALLRADEILASQ